MRASFFLHYIILTALIAAPIIGAAQEARSLSLGDAVQLATQNNRTLKAGALDISIAGEQVREAKSLSLPSAHLCEQYMH